MNILIIFDVRNQNLCTQIETKKTKKKIIHLYFQKQKICDRVHTADT